MAGLGDTDGYEGTAVVEVGRSRFDVQVRLRATSSPSMAAITGMGVFPHMKGWMACSAPARRPGC